MSLGLSTPRWHRVFSTAGMALTNTATTGHALASVMHRLSASQAPGRTRRQFRFAGSSRSHAGKRCQLTRRQTTAEGQGRRRGKAVRRATDVTPAESTPRACPDGFGVNAIPTQEAREGALARFDALRKRLEPELAELLACPPHTRIKTAGVKHVTAPKKPGVYLFYRERQPPLRWPQQEPQRAIRPARSRKLRGEFGTVCVQHRQTMRP